MELQRLLTRGVFVVCAGIGVIAAVACSSSPSTASSDPGAACDAFFDALNGTNQRCGGFGIPSEYKARFHTECVTTLAYPGEGITAQSLSDCAGVYGGAACRGSNGGLALTCTGKNGSLADGSACNGASQCKSGACEISASSDGGVQTVSYCGTCVPTIPNGQSCATSGTRCTSTASCVKGICVGYNTVDVGGDCLGSSVCKAGLACETQKCVALGGLGAACTSTAGCQDAFVCSAKVCAKPIALQGDCSQAADGCSVGTYCDVSTKKCVGISVAKPGQPCGFLTNGISVCAVGTCNLDPQKTTGTCPAIIPDGQACTPSDKTKVCDFDAHCTNSVCVLTNPACK